MTVTFNKFGSEIIPKLANTISDGTYISNDIADYESNLGSDQGVSYDHNTI